MKRWIMGCLLAVSAVGYGYWETSFTAEEGYTDAKLPKQIASDDSTLQWGGGGKDNIVDSNDGTVRLNDTSWAWNTWGYSLPFVAGETYVFQIDVTFKELKKQNNKDCVSIFMRKDKTNSNSRRYTLQSQDSMATYRLLRSVDPYPASPNIDSELIMKPGTIGSRTSKMLTLTLFATRTADPAVWDFHMTLHADGNFITEFSDPGYAAGASITSIANVYGGWNANNTGGIYERYIYNARLGVAKDFAKTQLYMMH